MESLIAFDIYRTENISVSGRKLTVRFLRRKDQEAYELLVSDESTEKVWKFCYSVETARDFAGQTREELEQHILEIIKGDITHGISHS